jgi:hypothetical protein
MESFRPIFIVGCHRSGKTLLRLMLDSHPMMAVPPESYFLTEAVWRRDQLTDPSGAVRPAEFLQWLNRHPRFQKWGVPIDEVRSRLQQNDPLTLSAALAAPFEAYARRQGKVRWGDKTPVYVRHLPSLISLYPEGTIVHLIRDGRDVAASTSARGYIPEIWSTAYHWKSMVSAGQRDGALLGDRYLEIRYEAFVAAPKEMLQMICDRAGLPYDDAMMDYPKRFKTAVLKHRQERRIKMGVAQPPTPGLRNWREELTQAQVGAFEAVAGDLLQDLGYGRSLRSIPWRLRLFSRIYVAAGALRRMIGSHWTYLDLRKRLIGRERVREPLVD